MERDVDRYLQKAQELADAGEFDQALGWLESILELRPDHVDALLEKASILVYDLDDPEAGLEVTERILSREIPADRRADALATRGTALTNLDRPHDALPLFDEGLAEDPECPFLWQGKAHALFQLGSFRAAVVAGHKAVEAKPDFAAAHFWLAASLERLGNVEKADLHFARAAELDPEGYPVPARIPRDEFDGMVRSAIASLPEDVRGKLDGVVIDVEDAPSREDFDGDPEAYQALLHGYYNGVPLKERSVDDEPSPGPDRILIFQRPHELSYITREEVQREVWKTLCHEVAHYLGFEEDDMRRLGLE